MAGTRTTRGTLPPYLQWFEPTRAYRFRRAVPKRLRPRIGLTEWTETLSPDRGEAARMLHPHIERTDRIIALAQAGNWPEITDEEIEALEIGWWNQWREDRARSLYLPGRPDHLQRRLHDIHPTEWALANEAELRQSVEQFIAGPRRLDAIFEPELGLIHRLLDDPKRATVFLRNPVAMSRLLRDCRLHHHALAGAWGDVLRLRERTVERVSVALDQEQLSPSQFEAVIDGRPVAASAANPVGYYPPLPLGHIVAEDELDLISRWAKEAEIKSRGIYQARLDMAKFVTVVGHDEANRVTPQEVVRFKQALTDKGLSGATINRYLSAIKSPLAWAAENHLIASNPSLGVKYNPKGGARPKVRRLGYDDRQSRIILLASRDEDKPHLRWIPWVCAFTGCRLDEIAGRAARDIQRFGSTWVLDIPEAKNDGSVRTIPLHTNLIAEGFDKYVLSLRNNGPLFPDLTDGRYGRAGTATKSIGRWLRKLQKEAGVLLVEKPRFAPNHSWRHRFKSQARRVGKDGRPIMSEETSDALTGHNEGKVSREYGEYYVNEVLRPAIEAMISPFDLPEGPEEAEAA
jgi:integrase